MNKKRYIGIFCSAKDTIPQKYFDDAIVASSICAKKGYSLLYGGDRVGLMGCVSRTFLEYGQSVIGICTKRMYAEKKYAQYCNRIIVVEDLKQRKDEMILKADVLLILPGGIGTLDEFFSAITMKDLGYIFKKIVLVNVDSFYSDLLCLLNKFSDQHFLKKDYHELFDIVNCVEELNEVLQ